MPYIEQSRRDAIEKGAAPENPGELNYRLTAQLLAAGEMAESVIHLLKSNLRKIADHYLVTVQIMHGAKLRYAHINDVIGAFYCATLEYERRMREARMPREIVAARCLTLLEVAKEFYDEVAVPYEKQKIRENGDIHYA